MKKPQYRRELSCSYLYADGTLMQNYTESRDGLNLGETWDVTYGYASVTGTTGYRGGAFSNDQYTTDACIIINRYEPGMLKLLKGAKVRFSIPTTESGSENTKKHNIAVGHLSVETKAIGELNWTVFASFISGPIHLQSIDKLPTTHPTGRKWEPCDYYHTNSYIASVATLSGHGFVKPAEVTDAA